MRRLSGLVPFSDLRSYDLNDGRGDLSAALILVLMAVPQGIAYAMIAGLPPVMGLYAASIPMIIGALFRSSRHVNVGPTNALSILIGSATLMSFQIDPMTAGLTLAFLVGVIQVCAGLIGLGVVIDFISVPVVLGYLTGAGVLIGVGQLPNLTSSVGGRGNVVERLYVWLGGLEHFNFSSAAIALGTIGLIVLLRRIDRKIPGPMLALMAATGVCVVFRLHELGIKRIVDLNPVPASLPSLTLPDLSMVGDLLPLAIAAAVLSLVEASSVGRSIGTMSGQKLDSRTDFVGLGFANVAGSLCGSYPVSGSLSRSTLNYTGGARTRLSGVYCGILMLTILLGFGPVVNHIPIAALAGLLMVVAYDLVDGLKIREIMAGSWGDRAAFLTTMVGTWTLPLDKAIYLGVVVSFIFLIRQFRFLKIKEFGKRDNGRWMARRIDSPSLLPLYRCKTVRILQVQGRLFFGVEGVLNEKLDNLVAPGHGLVLHLSHASGMDVSIIQYLREFVKRVRLGGGVLVFSGVSQSIYEVWLRCGFVEEVGESNIIRGEQDWDIQANSALERAWDGLEPSVCGTCESGCPAAPQKDSRLDAKVLPFPSRG